MRQHENRDRGASLVEFAFVVPLLTLFLFGIVQFGLAYDKQQSINAAVREGARRGALPTSDLDAIESSTRHSYQGLENAVDVTVDVSHSATGPVSDPTATPCAVAGNVIVVASVEHQLTIPFFGAPEITLDGRGQFRCETS